MSSMVLPAIMTMVVALAFMLLAYLQQVETSSEIYRAAIDPLVTSPWRIRPSKSLYDVTSANQAYQWLTEVFVNHLYREQTELGDEQGFCTTTHQCVLGEGHVTSEDECVSSLRPGDRNCPLFVGPNTNCCDPCIGDDCPEIEVATQTGVKVGSSSVPDLSANCAEVMPSYLSMMDQWNHEDRLPTDGSPNFSFCPERLEAENIHKEAVGHRRLMVGTFNRALMGRITVKRRKLRDYTSPVHTNAYGRVLINNNPRAGSYDPASEDTAPFGKFHEYTYQQGKGYNGAGGFVQVLDFDRPKNVILEQINVLKNNHWFDLSQGTLAVEMLLFNGNVEQFMYVSFVFEHDYSGQTKVSIQMSPLSLSIHDLASPLTYVRFALYIIIIVCIIISAKNELEDMSADYASYFSQPMGWVMIATFVLVLYVMVTFLSIVLSFTFLNFQFPMSSDPVERAEEFQNVAWLAQTNENYNILLGVVTFLFILQVTSVMTSLAPQWRLIVSSVNRMGKFLVQFYVVMVFMVIGFALAGQFIFGDTLNQFHSLGRSVLTVLQMISALANYDELIKTDPTFGDPYFLFFHFFFLIYQQFHGVMIMTGYLQEKNQKTAGDQAETYPLSRFIRSVKALVTRYSSFIRRCFASVLQILSLGRQSGGQQRVNYDQVAKLRDMRATKPMKRTVIYDPRADEQDGWELQQDVTLRAELPTYPDGMMHYYVQNTAAEGLARDAKVKKDFRLIGIQSQGVMNREQFRDPKKYNRDPQQVLKEYKRDHMPVSLEFEGRVRTFSLECIVFAFFCSVFVAFAIQVGRVEDTFNLTWIHTNALRGPRWMEYNPTRVMSLDNVSHPGPSYTKWVEEAILGGETSFISKIYCKGSECMADLDQVESSRKDWTLWVSDREVDLQPHLGSEDINIAEIDRPAGLKGFSLGYAPMSAVNLSDSIGSTKAEDVINLWRWNVGVMMNNHIRVTMQNTCYLPNTDVRFSLGYPYVVDPATVAACSDAKCMEDSLKASSKCYTFDGRERPEDGSVEGVTTGMKYEFLKDSGYANLGGVVLGLGKTPSEASAIVSLMTKDSLNPVSLVFEFVNYNGNLDMFTHTTVKYNLKATGILVKSMNVVAFPLNVFNMGSADFSSAKTDLNWFLFGAYIFGAVLFTIFLLRDLSIQIRLTSLTRPVTMFIMDFFMDDIWNIVDVACVVLNIILINAILNFILINGSFGLKNGFESWTLDYAFTTEVTSNHLDAFEEFNAAAITYERFQVLAAINGLVLCLRACKYFRSIPALRLCLTSLAAALWEGILIMTITIIFLAAFMVLMNMRFGVYIERLQSPFLAVQEMFLFLTGCFNTEDLYRLFPVFLTIVIISFQLVLRVVLDLYVSSVVFRWKDCRRDAEEFSISTTFKHLKDSLKLFRSAKQAKHTDEEKQLKPINLDFWQDLSILRHVASLDDNGKINLGRESVVEVVKKKRDSEDDKDGEDSDAGSDHASGVREGAFHFDREEDRQNFIKVLKKAHMEIASQMSRAVVIKKEDDIGAGVDLEDEEAQPEKEDDPEVAIEEILQRRLQEQAAEELLGIIEVHQPQETLDEKIINKLNNDLQESESSAEEIWLDALVTLLEECGALEKLQKLFKPMPMIYPKKNQEWQLFHDKKEKMERRLDRWFRLLKEESRAQHYMYLKDMAVSKERVLKQQSLVLTDYLQTLDLQIDRLEEEIKALERKNASVRAHVSPLV